MMKPIANLGTPALPVRLSSSGPASSSSAASFKNILIDSIERANCTQASAAGSDSAAGADANATQPNAATPNNNLAFRTASAVRDQLMGAYEEIKNIR